MAKSGFQFACPICNKAFSGKGNDFSRIKANKNFPLIINCGHSVCRGCAESSSNEKTCIICPTCQVKTPLEKEASVNLLISDFYLLGRLAAKDVSLNFDIKKNSAGSYTNSSEAESSSKVMCDECSHTGAVWRCDKCVANFCNVCFDLVHKSSRLMKRHEGKRIFVESYRTEVQEGCSEHGHRPIEFFCEDDEQLACSHCVVLGKHKDHRVITLAEKNKACSDKLKLRIEEGIKIQNRLQKTEKYLSKVLPDHNLVSSLHYGKIVDEFHMLHSFLQLREAELLAELDNILNSDIITLEEMRQKVSDQNKEITSVIKDAKQAVSNSLISMNVSDVIKKLNSLKDVPCYLIINEENSEIKLDFDSDIVDKVKSYGRIESNFMPKYILKNEEELPEDYEEPDDDDDITGDSESLMSVSDSAPEDILTPNGINIHSSSHHVPIFAKLQHENVFVTHILHPSQFWVQRGNDIRKLKSLSDSINKWCCSEKCERYIPPTLTVGELYLVQFGVDKNWYRARVKKIIEPSLPQDQIKTVNNDPASVTAEVAYIDYGNTEVVPLKRFREMQPRFLHLEGFATECSLWDILPNNDEKEWTKEAIKIFARFVAERELLMLVVEKQGNVLHVDLTQPGDEVRGIKNDLPVSVRDALVFMEVGCFVGNSGQEKKIQSPLSKIRMREFYPPEPIAIGRRINALLSHAVNPQHFYIQQMGSNARHLSDLIFFMQKEYSSAISDDSHFIYAPKKGMVCVCQYSLDKQWYRAQIIGMPGGAKVEVLYVDYGNTEIVTIKSLRKIIDDFTKLPCQAIKCSLVDIAPFEGNEWNPESTAWFTEIARNKELSLYVHKIIPGEGTAEVTLYCKENVDICVNGLIVKEGFAKSTGPESTVDKVPLPSTAATTTTSHKMIYSKNETIIKEKKKEKPVVKLPCSGSASNIQNEAKQKGYLAVSVSHVHSPDCINLHRIEQKEQLESMMAEIQKVYSQSQCKKMEIYEGKSYAVAHPVTRQWYRGHVNKILDNKPFAEVNFFDYGFTDLVDTAAIQKLLPPFVDKVVFGIRCRLDGIVPAGGSKWSHMACDTLKMLLSSVDVLYLQRTEKPPEDCTYSVDLFIKEVKSSALEVTSVKYKSISKMLIEKGVALPTKDRSERLSSTENIECDRKSPSEEKHQDQASSETTPTPSIAPTPEPVVKAPVTAKNLYIAMSSWKPSGNPERSSFIGIPSHVGLDGCIYFHIQGQGNLEIIKNALQMKINASDIEPPTGFPSPGQPCIAKFPLDRKWYRAVVTKVEPPDIEVIFVDYGNSEILLLADIRTEVLLAEIPCQAYECLLYGIEPLSEDGAWPIATLDFIHNTIVDQPCTMTVMKKGTPEERLQVKLELAGGIDITNILVDTKVAKRISEQPKESSAEVAVNPDSEENTEVIKEEKEAEEKTAVKKNPFTSANLPPLGTLFAVIVTQVLDYNLIYLQRHQIKDPKTESEKLINQEINDFLFMMENLSENGDQFAEVKDVKVGKAYCGKYTYDENWYRCLIEEVMDDAAVVTYVDYGNSETLPIESLRELPVEHLELPHQAVMCKICGIELTGDNNKDELVSSMATVFFPKEGTLMARVSKLGNPVEIDLFLQLSNKEPRLAFQDLIECGLIKRKETATEQQEIPPAH